MGALKPLAVTGAAGFLGRAIVRAAREAGHPVLAIVRGPVPDDWAGDEGIRPHTADLAAAVPGSAAAANLAMALSGAGPVIHAAAALSGCEEDHARDTLEATANLIAAMAGRGRLILVSSFSVYGYASLPDWAVLDETTPLEPDPARRDVYARAKIMQERLALPAAQSGGVEVRIARVGAIYGPGRTGTARLGMAKGGVVLCPDGNVPVPAVHVDHCAATLIAAASRPMEALDDFPILRGNGRIDIVNILDPDPPTQAGWLAAAPQGRMIRLPRRFLMKFARALDLLGDLWPGFGRRLPAALREATLAARYKPLRYSTARAEDRLCHRPGRSFADCMRQSLGQTR